MKIVQDRGWVCLTDGEAFLEREHLPTVPLRLTRWPHSGTQGSGLQPAAQAPGSVCAVACTGGHALRELSSGAAAGNVVGWQVGLRRSPLRVEPWLTHHSRSCSVAPKLTPTPGSLDLGVRCQDATKYTDLCDFREKH